MSYTYVLLHVSDETYKEIADKLREAGYGHVFISPEDGVPPVINMDGIALKKNKNQALDIT